MDYTAWRFCMMRQMAAQYLPRDLVRPSSGLCNNSLKRSRSHQDNPTEKTVLLSLILAALRAQTRPASTNKNSSSQTMARWYLPGGTREALFWFTGNQNTITVNQCKLSSCLPSFYKVATTCVNLAQLQCLTGSSAHWWNGKLFDLPAHWVRKFDNRSDRKWTNGLFVQTNTNYTYKNIN